MWSFGKKIFLLFESVIKKSTIFQLFEPSVVGFQVQKYQCVKTKIWMSFNKRQHAQNGPIRILAPFPAHMATQLPICILAIPLTG